MELIPYEQRYRKDFVELNTAWIVNLFGKLEKEDLETPYLSSV